MKGPVVFAALLVLVVTGIWLFRSPSRPMAARPLAVPEANERPAESRFVSGLQSPSAVPVEEAELEHVAAVSSETRESVGPPPRDTVAWVDVRVVATESGFPVAGVNVFVAQDPWRAGAVWESTGRALGAEDEMLVTDEAGRVRFQVTAGLGYKVHTEFRETPDRDASSAVPALAGGEEREVVLEIATLPDLTYFGRVVSTGGVPIPDAVVSLSDGQVALTGSDGVFVAHMASWNSPWGKVTAHGHEFVQFRIDSGHGSVEEARDLPLRRAATLGVTVLDAGGEVIRVVCTTDFRNVDASRRRFGGIGLDDPVWEGTTGMNGRCELPGLTPRAHLTLELYRGAERVKISSAPIWLEPGERREIELSLDGGTTILGTMVHAGGEPVADEEVWLVPADSDGESYMPNGLPADRATTDSSGKFEFANVDPGSWHVAPARVERESFVLDSDRIAPVKELIEIAATDTVRELTLTVHRGVYIQGVVLDPDGEPVAYRVGLLASQPDSKVLVHGTSIEDGSFILGPFVPGFYEVAVVEYSSRHGSPDAVLVEAGTEGLVIQLSRGAEIRGFVVDGTSGSLVEADILLFRQSERDGEPYLRTEGALFGEFEFTGLRGGSYVLTATGSDGRVGTARLELAGNGSTADLTITLQPASTLRVTHSSRARFAQIVVWREDALVAAAQLSGETTIAITTPPGRLRVVLLDSSGGEREQLVELGVGEERALVFGNE